VKQDFLCTNWLYKHRFTNVLVCIVIVINLLYISEHQANVHKLLINSAVNYAYVLEPGLQLKVTT